jgi:hypothetical protein
MFGAWSFRQDSPSRQDSMTEELPTVQGM